MTQTFKTKLMAAVFVPAIALAASATYATGDYKSPSANTTGTTATTPATSSSTQGSMKSGTTASADATFDRLDVNHDGKLGRKSTLTTRASSRRRSSRRMRRTSNSA